MTDHKVRIQVRPDATGYYAKHQGEWLSEPMPRAEALEIIQASPNGGEWQIVEDERRDGA